ncbi:MAG: hypothetical protein QW176_08575, partial [Candidatus Bathyarchaeia archaeon]
ISYPFNPEQVIHNIQHLRRAGLIDINWRRRTIKREKPMKDYVTKQVMGSELWPKIAEDWLKISEIIKAKYNIVNMEYQNLLSI